MTTTDLITFFTYLLALQKCPHSSDYTIHGLWIDYNKGGYPEFCRNIKYDENILSPLKSQLDTYWKSCYGSHTNSDLWKHEWQKHGTCFNPDITYMTISIILLNCIQNIKQNLIKNVMVKENVLSI